MLPEDTGSTDAHDDPHTRTVARLVLDYLRLEGVDKIFGYPGTALQYTLHEILHDEAIDYVICRQETGAAYMADAYARISGKLGVVLVTTGPGATNALTGVVNAQTANSSVLIITAEVAQDDWGKSALQSGVDGALDVSAVYRNACEYSAIITSAANTTTLLTQALRAARSIPHRAAHLSLPDQIAGEQVPDQMAPQSPDRYRAIPASANYHQVQQVVAHLVEAKLPLLWLGNGCRRVLLYAERDSIESSAHITDRRNQFYEVIDQWALPVVTTGNGKGVFPEDHPLSLRNYGLGGGPWPSFYVHPQVTDPALEAHYDCLCILGSSLSQLGTGSWNQEMIPQGPVIQVDADQHVIGRGYPIDQGVVAELGMFIDQFIEILSKQTLDPALCEQRRGYVNKVHEIAYPQANLQAQYLIRLLDNLPSDSHIFVDACSADYLSLLYMTIKPPMQMHNSLVQGPIGAAIAGVVGASFVTDRTCVAICGDGGFLMQGAEVNTAAQHRQGALWIVFQNQELGTVVQKMWKDFPQSGDASWEKMLAIGAADIVKIAEGFGADATRVDQLDQLDQAVATSLERGRQHRRPQVIVIPVPLFPIPEVAHPHSGAVHQ